MAESANLLQTFGLLSRLRIYLTGSVGLYKSCLLGIVLVRIPGWLSRLAFLKDSISSYGRSLRDFIRYKRDGLQPASGCIHHTSQSTQRLCKHVCPKASSRNTPEGYENYHGNRPLRAQDAKPWFRLALRNGTGRDAKLCSGSH